MAIGYPPKHAEIYQLNGLTPYQFVALAIEAAIAMKWGIAYISNEGIIAHTNNGAAKRNSEIIIKLENDTATIKSTSAGSELIDLGKNKKTVLDFIDQLNDKRAILLPEELTARYQSLLENNAIAFDGYLNRLPASGNQVPGFMAVFKPAKDYFITPILADINILIFILMAISGVNIMEPGNENLLKWGANFRPLTLDGQWWRLITNCFLHIGLIHLLMNMYALIFIGLLLEPHLGKIRFLSAYILAGIGASVVSIWWHELTISAGASGAIFGMYGVFLAMLTTNLIEKRQRKAQLASILFFVGYNLLNGVQGGIDNAAHIGGLICGLIIGYASIPGLKKPEAKGLKYATVALLTIVLLSSSFLIFKNTSNDIGKYDAKMKIFGANEKLALEVFNLPPDTPTDKMIHLLRDSGIYKWNENLKLLDECRPLKLSDGLVKRNELLRRYCLLRINSYELMCRYIADNTESQRNNLAEYNAKIKEVIDSLDGKIKLEHK